MKVLIFGGSGLIGSKLSLLLSNEHEVTYTYNKNNIKLENCNDFKLDISNRPAVFDLVKKVSPDLVIHTIALKGTDLCETNKKLAHDITVQGTQNIIDACKALNPFVIYISSAFVFDGEKSVFTEEDIPNPINYYGQVKSDAEKIISASNLQFMIARVDQLYGWTITGQPENTVTTNLKKLSRGEKLEEINDWYNNPTLADNAAEVIIKLFQKKKTGIYHVVGSDFLNRVEWSIKIADAFGFDKNLIESKSSEKLNLPAKRPNVNLSNEKAQKDSGIKLVSVEEGLKFMRS